MPKRRQPDVSNAQSLDDLREQALRCRNCPLWKNATQTVFGEGSESARVMLIGEQPGNQEDLEGRPFVGPAGKVLSKALEEVGIPRKEIWVTNAVKHFKWKPRGKFRLHQKPSAGEIDACKPWLLGELSRIAPQVVVLLGATAARSFFGKPMSVTKNRGWVETADSGPRVILTVHPSFLLRIPEPDRKEEEYRKFTEDLSLAAKVRK